MGGLFDKVGVVGSLISIYIDTELAIVAYESGELEELMLSTSNVLLSAMGILITYANVTPQTKVAVLLLSSVNLIGQSILSYLKERRKENLLEFLPTVYESINLRFSLLNCNIGIYIQEKSLIKSIQGHGDITNIDIKLINDMIDDEFDKTYRKINSDIFDYQRIYKDFSEFRLPDPDVVFSENLKDLMLSEVNKSLDLYIEFYGLNSPPSSFDYKDVKEGDWWYPYIHGLENIGGVTSARDYFRPEDKIRRIEFLAMFLKSLGVVNEDQEKEYDSWFDPYIDKSNKYYLINKDFFEDDKKNLLITRDECAKIMYGSVSHHFGFIDKSILSDSSKIKDIGDVSYEMKLLYEYGIIKGYVGGYLKPDQEISRAEAAKMIVLMRSYSIGNDPFFHLYFFE